VVVGQAPADQEMKANIRQTVADMGLRMGVSYTDGLTLAGMEKAVAAARPNTIILYGLVGSDSAGEQSVPAEMAQRIVAVAAAPTFTLYSTMMGQGLLGGAVQHVEKIGVLAARESLALLAGTRQLEPGVTLMPIAPSSMYDWQVLKRWKGDPGVLPDDTVFVNRPASLVRDHPRATFLVCAVILVLSALSAVLWLQRRRLRHAEASSRVNEARFRVLFESAPEAVVVYDVLAKRIVDANHKAELMFGCDREHLLAGGPERFYADEQPDGKPHSESIGEHSERGLSGELLVFERNVRVGDGSVIPVEVRLVALPSESGTLLRGGYMDISARKKAEAELLRHRDHLEDQVAERTEALSIAVRRAEAESRAKSVFLANMSHELRTPLNAIIGFSHIMSESTSMFDEEKRNLGIIHRSGQHLLKLINDILELSRIEAGQARLDARTVHIGQMLHDLQAHLLPAAREKAIALHLDCPTLPPPVVLDGDKLRQVLAKLCSNAVKFTDSGSATLGLTWSAAGADTVALHFTVCDTGPGIAAGEQARIFEPFIQAAGSGARAGAGLGLAIAREFVQLLGGALTLCSAPGQGARFSFTLQAPIDHAAAPETMPLLAAAPNPSQARLAVLDAASLAALAPAERDALKAALQQLDSARLASLLGAIRPAHGALVEAMEAMVERHQYRQLCALLEQSASVGS
jgi:two-component system sensor histidine kinase/response regulator